MTRHELARFWDDEIERWLQGQPLAPALREWQRAYRGELEDWAFPEPFIGDLLGSPRVVLLANNPGIAREELQARDGVFAAQILNTGFTRWASTRPFDSPDSEWVRRCGPIRHRVRRLEFARRFVYDETLDFRDMLTVELFPWHSRSLTTSIRVRPQVLREFIIEPISEFGSDVPVIALARGWADALERTSDLLEDVQHLDGFKVPSRRARLYRTRGGGRILVVWHSGSDAPPAAPDTERLRTAWFDGFDLTSVDR
jgi:hypothetical protein